MSRKKYKSLLNSIPNGSDIDGALQKIREKFLEDLQDEINKLSPDFNVMGDKLNSILEEFEKVFSEKEKRAVNIKNYLNNVNINEKYEKFCIVLNSMKEKTDIIESSFDKVTEIIDRGEKNIQNILKEGIEVLQTSLEKSSKGISSKQDIALKGIQTMIEKYKLNLNDMVDVWKQSIQDRTETFEKEFNLYVEKRGLELIIEYVQNNAFKLLWTLFIGIFKKYKQKKSK